MNRFLARGGHLACLLATALPFSAGCSKATLGGGGKLVSQASVSSGEKSKGGSGDDAERPSADATAASNGPLLEDNGQTLVSGEVGERIRISPNGVVDRTPSGDQQGSEAGSSPSTGGDESDQDASSSGEGLVWKSSDDRVATVDQHGNVVFVGAGDATIKGIDAAGNVVVTVLVHIASSSDKGLATTFGKKTVGGTLSLNSCQWYGANAAGQTVPSPNCEGSYYDHTVCPSGMVQAGIDFCSRSLQMIPVRIHCCTL